MTNGTDKPNWARFAAVFFATCALYVIVDWIFFGPPVARRLPGMFGAAIALAYVFGLRPQWTARFTSRG